MRRAYQDVGIYLDDNGSIIGAALGWDFTAEHEWGISYIKHAFGMQDEPTRSCYGIECRTVTKVPKSLYFYEMKREWKDWNSKTRRNRKSSAMFGYLVFHDWPRLASQDVTGEGLDSLMGSTIDIGDKEVAAAWDSKSFAIRVCGEERIKQLRDLYEALQRCDAAIFMGGNTKNNPFSRSGLTVAIRSKLPQNVLEAHSKTDLERLELQEAMEQSGIEEILRKAGKGFYSLKPDYHKHDDGTKELMFWLNPHEQHLYNYGWMSLDDLKDWAQNKGKVMKNSAA
jgi:hypothetical protein